MGPYHHPYWRQAIRAKPLRNNGVMPPLHLNDVRRGQGIIEHFPGWTHQDPTTVRAYVFHELKLFGDFEAYDGVPGMAALSAGCLYKPREHPADTASKVGRYMHYMHHRSGSYFIHRLSHSGDRKGMTAVRPTRRHAFSRRLAKDIEPNAFRSTG